MKKIQACLIGNNQNAGKEALTLAFSTGALFAKLGITLVCGGRLGIMKEGCRGAKENGGLNVCILPGDSLGEANTYCDVIIPTGIGYARNMINVLSCDFVVAIGGGCGTLTEIAYAWQFGKKIYAFNSVEGWSKELSGKTLDNKTDIPIIAVSSVDQLETLIKKDFLSL